MNGDVDRKQINRDEGKRQMNKDIDRQIDQWSSR